MSEDSFYTQVFKKHFHSKIRIEAISAVSGGCINQTSKVLTNAGTYFIKVNSTELLELFQKEEKGLKVLQEKSQLRVPDVLGSGSDSANSYLILEWIEKGAQNQTFWSDFGRQLGVQHSLKSAHFGLDHNNHIGRLHQSNKTHADWSKFFILERIQPQLKIAEQKGLIDTSIQKAFEKLFPMLDHLIPKEDPSLLHGDLWSGNFLCGPESKPFIFDPAIYYGHRETEIAFTTMFGGFDQRFYEAYAEVRELELGFDDRIEIHNLYPLLVHVNLFGDSYLSGIRNTLRRFT